MDDTKHTYNQAFAIYALSAYFDAFEDAEAFKYAHVLRRLIETKCRDKEGYLEAFTRYFEPAGNDKLSENGVEAKRTMNTLLHVYEAYTEYLRVMKKAFGKGHKCIGDVNLKEEIGAVEDNIRFMLHIITDKIYNPKLMRQEVFFDMNYNSLIDLHSYGHDIETSWLVDLGLTILDDDKETRRVRPILQDMAKHVYERAYAGHSVLNECEKGRDDTTRVWWIQAEAVLGFFNAYRRNVESGNAKEASKYLEAAEDIWSYIKDIMVDKRPGSEWLSQVDKYGNPDSRRDIVEPWKCPYHNGRMCIMMQYAEE